MSLSIWLFSIGMAFGAQVSTYKNDRIYGDRIYSDGIYQETLAQCQNSGWVTSWLNKNTFEAALISAGQSLGFVYRLVLPTTSSQAREEDVQYLNHQMIGVYTLDRLESEGYQAALRVCFGEREDLQRNFTLAMMIGDYVGKIPAIFLGVVSFKSMNLVLTTMRVKYPMVHKALVIGFVASVIYQVHKVYLQESSIKEDERRVEDIERALDQITQESRNQTYDLARETIEKLKAKIVIEKNQTKKAEMLTALRQLQMALEQMNYDSK